MRKRPGWCVFILYAAVLQLFLTVSCSRSKTEGAVIPSIRMAKAAPADMLSTSSTVLPEHVGEQKLIKTGSLEFEVESLSSTEQAVENWVKKVNGYVSDTSEDGRSLSMTVQVPAASFEEAMVSSGAIGKITSKSMNSQDVTEQYYDLNTRLSTRHILLDRLQVYLKEAKNISDMIDVETKINDVTSELERMQGQMNRLSKQIAYSQITITARLPVNRTESGFIFPDTKTELGAFLGNVLSFFNHFVFTILYIIIFGIPIVLVLAFLYWICLGKVGLLRRLFSKIRNEK